MEIFRVGSHWIESISLGSAELARSVRNLDERSKGVQCYGIGPALDYEDGGKGYGAHSDQERILEAELYRFVRFQYDVVMDVAHAK